MKVAMRPDLTRNVSLSEADVLVELAVLLYQRDKLSLGHAAKLAGMKKTDFNHLLAVRDVPMHYDLQDWEQDLVTLRSLVRR